MTWITRHVDEHAALVVIEGVGSYGAGLTGCVVNAGVTVVEPALMAAGHRRAVGKTDAMDAVQIARSVRAVDTSRLRLTRATGSREVVRVLVVAREQMAR